MASASWGMIGCQGGEEEACRWCHLSLGICRRLNPRLFENPVMRPRVCKVLGWTSDLQFMLIHKGSFEYKSADTEEETYNGTLDVKMPA